MGSGRASNTMSTATEWQWGYQSAWPVAVCITCFLASIFHRSKCLSAKLSLKSSAGCWPCYYLTEVSLARQTCLHASGSGWARDSNRKARVPQSMALQGLKEVGLRSLCPAKLTLCCFPDQGCPPPAPQSVSSWEGLWQDSGEPCQGSQCCQAKLCPDPRATEPRMHWWCAGLPSGWSVSCLHCPICEVVYFW